MKEERIDQWHPAFVSALRMEFETDWDVLEFDEEYQLTDKPQSIDCVVVKKLEDVVTKNSIGRRFKRYNLFEYKSPKDEMNIDTFYKVLGYGCMFKALARHVDEIPAEEITLTMLRDVCPVKLFSILKESGFSCREEEKGIYRVLGPIPFEFQIVVSSELDEGEHLYFKSLTNHISRKTFMDYISRFGKLEGIRREYADIILELIISANQEEVRSWKEDENMCQAMRMIMSEELCSI